MSSLSRETDPTRAPSGEKLRGRWHLVRTKPTPGGKPQWMLFKAKDEHASATYDVVAERPESVVSGRRVTRGPTLAAFAAAPASLLSHLLWL